MKFRTWGTVLLTALLICTGVMAMGAEDVYAASAMIEFGVNESEVSAGGTFTVVMSVNASDMINSVDAYITYDSALVSYISGGKYVSGGEGLLHVAASGLGGKKDHIKFSLQFKALSKGNTAIGISDTATVTDASDTKMSTSSNRVSVNIGGSSDGTTAAQGQPQAPSASAAPVLSSDNRLTGLLVSNGTLEPDFNSEVTRYSLVVDNRTTNLYFSYTASDPQAAVAFSGNENLKEGRNSVKVIVTAPDGEVRKYAIKVSRETEEETRLREMAENSGTDGIGFNVAEEGGEVYLSNNYEYKIVDVEDSSMVPKGYVKTSVRLLGVNVTAYTMANDLENDYLLMYCMNSTGDKEFYQFDRQEKSLQRYTGDLIDRVNSSEAVESSENMTAREYEGNLRQMAVIIAVMAAVIVFLVIGIISIALRTIRKGSAKTDDELDF